jgi:hypothetical protein
MLSFAKNDIFCSLCKKIKSISHKAIFNTKFCLFTEDTQKRWFCMKRLYEHIEYRDVRANFFVRIFWYLKMFLNQNV